MFIVYNRVIVEASILALVVVVALSRHHTRLLYKSFDAIADESSEQLKKTRENLQVVNLRFREFSGSLIVTSCLLMHNLLNLDLAVLYNSFEYTGRFLPSLFKATNSNEARTCNEF